MGKLKITIELDDPADFRTVFGIQTPEEVSEIIRKRITGNTPQVELFGHEKPKPIAPVERPAEPVYMALKVESKVEHNTEPESEPPPEPVIQPSAKVDQVLRQEWAANEPPITITERLKWAKRRADILGWNGKPDGTITICCGRCGKDIEVPGRSIRFYCTQCAAEIRKGATGKKR